MTTRTFLRNDGQFQQVDAGSISISTTTTTGFLTYLTKATTADITINSTATYADGPSVAQGSSGVWYATGTITIGSTIAQEDFNVKLWDGTTAISVTTVANPFFTVGGIATASLSGVLASPAGNLRISARGGNAGISNAKILFNYSGESIDSTITAIRIG